MCVKRFDTAVSPLVNFSIVRFLQLHQPYAHLALNALLIVSFCACKLRSFFSKTPADKGDSTPSPGGQFVYEEDWGEKYDGVSIRL